MKKLIIYLTLLLGVISYGLSGKTVSAQYTQPPSYSISINKMVGLPGTSNDASSYQYYDNLGVTDPRFSPGQYVFFKVIVKNTSTTTLGDMTVKDYVPVYLTPIEGPGTFDSISRTLSWDGGFFDVNQEKTYYLKMQVEQQNSLPSDKGLFCIINRAQATSNTTSGEDSIQLCIEKQVAAPPKVPSAGPEMGLILVAGEIALFVGGLTLKYKLGRHN